MARFFAVATLFLTAASPAIASQEALDVRHQLSGINSRFNFAGNQFNDYIRSTREMIRSARTDLNATYDADHVVDGNAPFELRPSADCPAGKEKRYRRGVLLTHGLTDSPYFMRPLGRIFRDRCFLVKAILLPGHGTRPGDLLQVTWQEWAKAVAFGVDSLAREVDSIYVAGFSTGGALSIHRSIHDPRIRGVFLFAPAVKISPFGIMANWHEAYSWLSPKAKWLDIAPDLDPYKYESFPANAADQIHLLTVQLVADLNRQKRFMPPVFAAISEDDASVFSSATVQFFKEAIHPLSTLVLYTTNSKDTILPDISSDKVKRVNSHLPERRILSSAHTAIVLPPDDPHYGASGTYASCLHYYPKALDKYRQCKSKKEDFLGEVTESNLKKGIIRRLTYNFDFDNLTVLLSNFVESLPAE